MDSEIYQSFQELVDFLLITKIISRIGFSGSSDANIQKFALIFQRKNILVRNVVAQVNHVIAFQIFFSSKIAVPLFFRTLGRRLKTNFPPTIRTPWISLKKIL